MLYMGRGHRLLSQAKPHGSICPMKKQLIGIIPIIMCVCLGFIIIIVFAEKCVCDVFRLANTVFEAGNL